MCLFGAVVIVICLLMSTISNVLPVEAFGQSGCDRRVVSASLGSHALQLLGGSRTWVGSMSVSTLVYTIYDHPCRVRVMSATATEVRMLSADMQVARGAFVSEHVQLLPSSTDVLKRTTPNNVRMFTISSGQSGSQMFGLTQRNVDTPFDLELWSSIRSNPILFRAVRVSLDRNTYARGHPGNFHTPEVLKRNILAGVTLVVPTSRSQHAVVAFRRYRERTGYVVFSVSVGRDHVTVRHIMYRKSRPPVEVDNAIAALQWDGTGEFNDAMFRSTSVGVDRVNAEVMAAGEIRKSMEVAVSVSVAMRQRKYAVVDITPGVVRVSSLSGKAGDTDVESRVALIQPMMSGPKDRWAPDSTRPLQMQSRGAVVIPAPTGDHVSLCEFLDGESESFSIDR